MLDTRIEAETKLAVIGDIGRGGVRLALTDEGGRLRPETVRSYDSAQHSTISGALSSFGRTHALDTLPSRCAIAISGPTLGDTIAVTNSRWFVSRSGLAAMLRSPPLILNDFAAKAWAIGAPGSGARFEPVSGPAPRPDQPGTRCLIGVGSGLGVAVMTRDSRGGLSVLPTEAGHCHFIGDLAPMRTVLLRMRKANGAVTAEDLLSARGLVSIYETIAEVDSACPRTSDASEIIRLATQARDSCAMRAAELFCRTLWYFAGNMVLAYGAWDGVMLTGSIVQALRGLLHQQCCSSHFVLDGPYRRQLQDVPRAVVTLEHGELHGAAQALLLH